MVAIALLPLPLTITTAIIVCPVSFHGLHLHEMLSRYRYGSILLPKTIGLSEMKRECAFFQLPDDVRITQERPSLVQSSAWYEEAINKLEQDRRGMCGCTTCHLHLLVKFCDSVGLEVKKVLSFVPHACSQGRIEHDLQDCVDQIKCAEDRMEEAKIDLALAKVMRTLLSKLRKSTLSGKQVLSGGQIMMILATAQGYSKMHDA